MSKSAALVLITLFASAFCNSPLLAQSQQPIVLKQNGSWCWFQSPRAIVIDRRVVFTSVAGDDHGEWDAGDLVATCYDPESGSIENYLLHAKLNRDDHAVAGLCLLSDQRLLAVYGKHGRDSLQRWRTTASPNRIGKWTDEQTIDVGASYTYSNVYRLPAENNRIYNFHRGLGYNPNCTLSNDGGASWQRGWRLLEWTREDLAEDPRYTGMDGSRPYVCYASNGDDAIHFVISDDHPRAYDNSIYHGYYQNGNLFGSDGRKLATPTTDLYKPKKPRDFTELFNGNADQVAWPCDIQVDLAGHPYVAFSVQVDGKKTRTERRKGGNDHRYYFGRWDGQRWRVYPMAYAGTRLYAGEDDYTGLVALDPNDPTTVVISTNADPKTGKPLVSSADGVRHWELFRGNTPDGGASWNWTALTRNSNVDQLRPLIPDWPNGPRVILWARGKLTSYKEYHLDIVALVEQRKR